MAGRDHAGVAPARAGGDLAVAFDDHDLVAVPLQLIGRGDADHAAAEHDYAHGGFAPPAVRRPVPEAGWDRSAKSDVRRSFIAQTRSCRRRTEQTAAVRPSDCRDQSTTPRANKQSGQSGPVDALERYPERPSLALNAANSASVAKDFCAPWRVTEKAE